MLYNPLLISVKKFLETTMVFFAGKSIFSTAEVQNMDISRKRMVKLIIVSLFIIEG